MKKTISYELLRDICLYAESQAKLWYKQFNSEEDLNLATQAYELRQELTESPAYFFEITDNDPFEVTPEGIRQDIITKFSDIYGDAYDEEPA